MELMRRNETHRKCLTLWECVLRGSQLLSDAFWGPYRLDVLHGMFTWCSLFCPTHHDVLMLVVDSISGRVRAFVDTLVLNICI